MKGILLCGGLGTRLYPTTRIVNKHMLIVYDRPMFYWPLKTLIDSGINQIAVVSGAPTGSQIKQALGYFPKTQNIKFTYVNQPKPLGIPNAIYLCRNFVGSDSFIVSVGDNIYGRDFSTEVEKFKDGAVSFIRKVKDQNRFGVAKFDKYNKIIAIIEKPKKYVSDWAVGAPYIFDNKAIEKIRSLKPSGRGELEIVDLLSFYIKEEKLKLYKRRDIWIDAGTAESLLKANLIAKKLSNFS